MSKLLLLLAGMVVLGGCIHERFYPQATPETQQPPSVEVTATPTEVVVSPTGALPTGEVIEFAVDASEYKFTPKVLNAKVGDRIRLTLTNAGRMPHDWRLDEFSAATQILQPGQTETIEFVASAAGSFEFYCSVNTHRSMGMVGVLNIR